MALFYNPLTYNTNNDLLDVNDKHCIDSISTKEVILEALQKDSIRLQGVYYICPYPVNTYLIFALVTATERALHCIAALYSNLSPNNHAGGWLFGALHNKTAAGHAEGWGDLGEDLRKRLKNRENV